MSVKAATQAKRKAAYKKATYIKRAPAERKIASQEAMIKEQMAIIQKQHKTIQEWEAKFKKIEASQ